MLSQKEFKLAATFNVEDVDALGNVLELAGTAVYWTDAVGSMVGSNTCFRRMFGLENHAAIAGVKEIEFWEQAADDSANADHRHHPSDRHERRVIEKHKTRNGAQQSYLIAEGILIDLDGLPVGTLCVCQKYSNPDSVQTGACLTALDRVEPKEPDSLLRESEQHLIIEGKNEQFRNIANQVAHDIASPLAALSMIIPSLTDIAESVRITLNQAVSRIEDISGELLRQFKSRDTSGSKEPVHLFVAMELMGVLSEKRSQFSKAPVKFTEVIADNAWFAFVSVNRSDWQRMLSNLINNSVDSFSGRAGEVQLELGVADGDVVMVVSDNGKGMSALLCKTIARCIPVTVDKTDGHGIGLSQVAGVLQRNAGQLDIDSSLGGGTRMTISFPLVDKPEWAATQLNLNSDQLVLVLDDDEFIHGAWDARFQGILQINSAMQLIHFTKAEELLVFIALLSDADLPRIYLLSDYELLNQEMNGLDIIEQRQITQATLVTSHYGNANVIARAKNLQIQVLPKRLAPKIPIVLN